MLAVNAVAYTKEFVEANKISATCEWKRKETQKIDKILSNQSIILVAGLGANQARYTFTQRNGVFYVRKSDLEEFEVVNEEDVKYNLGVKTTNHFKIMVKKGENLEIWILEYIKFYF